jgi:phage tail sheath protein FI
MALIHGIEVKIEKEGTAPVVVSSQSVLGVVVVSSKLAATEKGKLHVITKESEAKSKFGESTTADTPADTAAKVMRSIYLVSEAVVVVSVAKSNSKADIEAAIDLLGNAPSQVGVTPKLLAMPRYASFGVKIPTTGEGETNTNEGDTPAPEGNQPDVTPAPAEAEAKTDTHLLAGRLARVAEGLGAIAILEVVGSTKAEALAWKKLVDANSSAYYVFPELDLDGVGVFGASAAVASHFARNDEVNGFWVSPSNKRIPGIKRLAVPLSWFINKSSDADELNGENINTFISNQGFKLWGNRTDAPKEEFVFKFVNSVRIKNFLADALFLSLDTDVDSNVDKQFIKGVLEKMGELFRALKSRRALIGGEVWFDPEANTPTSLADGNPAFDFSYTPPAPAEKITIRLRPSNRYYAEVLA